MRVGAFENGVGGTEEVAYGEALVAPKPRGVARTARNRVVKHHNRLAFEVLQKRSDVPRISLEEPRSAEPKRLLEGPVEFRRFLDRYAFGLPRAACKEEGPHVGLEHVRQVHGRHWLGGVESAIKAGARIFVGRELDTPRLLPAKARPFGLRGGRMFAIPTPGEAALRLAGIYRDDAPQLLVGPIRTRRVEGQNSRDVGWGVARAGRVGEKPRIVGDGGAEA